MRSSLKRNVLRGVLLLVACACFAFSFVVEHKVFDDDEMAREFGDLGMLTHRKISEAQLTTDATFSGTVHKMDTIEVDGQSRQIRRLYSTYDRSQPRGKRLCPT